jgi:hypothetical protein
VTFSQRVGIVQDPTTIHWDLTSLPTTSPISQQIHSYATTNNNCTNLGPVYNPFGVSHC